MKAFRIDKVVGVEQGYKTEVDLKREIADKKQNEMRLKAYIPTKPASSVLKEIGKAIAPQWERRARFLTGQYGSGKSHLGLVIANVLSLPAKDKTLGQFIKRLERKDQEAAKPFTQARLQGKISEPFLIVLPDPQSDNFNMALLAALEKSLLKAEINYQFRTYFDEAIKTLAELQKDPELEKRIVDELEKRQMNVEILRSNLQKYRDEDFRIFQEVVQTATRMPFVPSAHAAAGPVFLEAAKEVRKVGYAGILVIADEFGKHLTNLATSRQPTEALAIQDFAQACNRSRENQIHFLSIAHKTLADYGSSAIDSDDWEKVAGRFTEHNLDYAQGQEEETVDLISTVLFHKDSSETQQANWKEIIANIGPIDDWVVNAGLYKETDKKWRRNELIAGCYPLHPATVFCLPWLALRVGQRERTAIRFLSSDQDGSLVHFMSASPAFFAEKTLSLYTPDMLLDFFGSAAKLHEDYGADMRAYEEAFARCGHEEMAHRIIKFITVLTIVGQPAFPATEKNITTTLGKTAQEREDFGRILHELDVQGFVRLHEASGHYELPRRSEGDLPPREALDQIKSKWSASRFDGLKEIKRLRNETDIRASTYQTKKALPRTANVSYVSADHLDNLAAPEETINSWYEPGAGNYQGDAMLWYVVAFDKADVSRAEKALRQGTKTEQHLVAVPKLHFDRLEELKDLAAIQELQKGGRKLGDSIVDATALKRLEEQITSEVNEAIEQYFAASNFQWQHGKNRNVRIKDGGEEAFISGLFNSLFPDTPAIADKAVSLGRITAGENRARKAAITKLIEVKGGALQIETKGGSAENRILRSVLYNTELFTKEDDLGHEIEIEISKKVPTRSVFGKIWKLIDAELAQENEDIFFDKLVRTLLSPPYGLPSPLIEVLLAAYMRAKRGNFQIFGKDNEVHVPSADLVERIVKSPDDYLLLYYEFLPAEKDWLRSIIDLMPAQQLPDIGLVDQARDALVGWAGGLPAGTRSARDHSESVTAIFELISDDSRTGDSKKFLLEELPKALGFTSQQITSKDVEKMRSSLQESKNLADNYIQRRAQEAIEELCDTFGVSGRNLEALVDGMQEWWDELRADQRMHGYDADIQALNDRLRQGKIDEEQLLSELPIAMSLRPYTDWTDSRDLDMFIRQVQNAKRVVENYDGREKTKGDGPGDAKPPVDDIKKRILQLLEDAYKEPSDRIKFLKSLLEELQK